MRDEKWSGIIFVDSIPVVESWKTPWCSDSFFPEARTSLVPFPFLLVECPFLFILSGQIIMFHWHETCSQLWGWIPAIEFPWFQVGSRCHRSLLNLPRFYPPRGHSTQPGLFWCWTKISSQIGPRVGEGRSLWRNFWIYGDLKMYPLVMTNSLPWKDPPFLIGKPSINGLFSMAMFNNQMVHLESSRYHNWEFYWDCTGKMILGKTDREWICKQHLEF